MTCFTLQEQKKIEQAVLTDSRDKMLGVEFSLYTGLRIGELLALKWSNVDFTKGTIVVNRTCHDGQDKNRKLCRVEDTQKTASSRRTIPLPKQVLQLLKRQKNKAKANT